jgi:heme exporter protein D
MLRQAEAAPDSPLKNPKVYLWMAIVVSMLVVGWILISRWIENRGIETKAREAQSRKQREQDRATVDQMGGKDLAVLGFYAIPGEVHRGQAVQICYSVANAKSVKLEPQSNPVWPSYSRCIDVTPAKSTIYTLTISDARGNTKTQTLEVKVL